MNYATANGTAVEASDYNAVNGSLTIAAPGTTSRTLTVGIIGDSNDEPSESFLMNLLNLTNATFLNNKSQGTITITDNDAVPTIKVADASVIEGSSGTSNAVFTVSLSAASGFTVTASYATANGTATTANNDYTAATGR